MIRNRTLEKDILSWLPTLVQPTTSDLCRTVCSSNPGASRASIRASLRALEADGTIQSEANTWRLVSAPRIRNTVTLGLGGTSSATVLCPILEAHLRGPLAEAATASSSNNWE